MGYHITTSISLNIATHGYMQIHYNQGADLFTYLVNTSVFDIHDGCVKTLEGVANSELTVLPAEDRCPGPGLGIEINEALVREAAAKHLKEQPWRSPAIRGEDGCLREW